MKKNISRKKRTVTLQWEGKGAPAPDSGGQLRGVSSHGSGKSKNLLVSGDNLPAMRLLADRFNNKVNLIYIDPPYATGKIFHARKNAAGAGGARSDFDDRWSGGIADYLDMLGPRLELMKNLLAPDGSIYVHLDWRAAHYAKILMDEIFGIDNFQNEIVWCYREAVNSKKRWNRKHDTILFYSRGKDFVFNYGEALEPHSEATIRKYRRKDENGPYRLMGRGLVGSPIRSARDVAPEWEEKHPELTFRHYLAKGKLPVDYWFIDIVNQAAKERTGYSTQKPEMLLKKIISASSRPGDIVADFFCGSGTTPAAAAKLGRKWIACDSSPAAIETTEKRLIEIKESSPFEVVEVEG